MSEESPPIGLDADDARVPPGHDLDEDGDHDPDGCYACLLTREVKSTCRCAECCRLLIEVGLQDAEREPKIKEKGSPILSDPAFSPTGEREVEGYLLNSADNDHACVFLDEATNLCTIYNTRPLVCRLFSCDGEDREELVELGILPPRQSR